MSEWQAVIPFAPQATPRPQFKFVKNSGNRGKVIRSEERRVGKECKYRGVHEH